MERSIPLPDPFKLHAEGARFGLKFGVTLSRGPIKSRSIASFARSDREFTDEEMCLNASASSTACIDMTKPPEELTKAQIEALRCIAGGDRHAAAADKLGISESALKARLTSARIRLDGADHGGSDQKGAKDYRLL